jgi:hypothetical protein
VERKLNTTMKLNYQTNLALKDKIERKLNFLKNSNGKKNQVNLS